MPGTNTLAEPISVVFDASTFVVTLSDEREIRVPIKWFPRLQRAKPKQREEFELSATGIHWENLDEDISVAGLLAGKMDLTRKHAVAA